LEINLIIRELLAKHDFISLPGIGSFIQKYEPAYPSPDGKGFISPKQSITFDSSRTFNDEAIENWLCEKMGISHSNASEILAEFINRIKEEIENGKEFSFENVGSLSKDKKGKIQFEQAKELDAALSTYGLKDIDVAKITSGDKPKTSTKANIQRDSSKPEINPAKKSSSLKVVIGISIVVAIAAIAATFILIPEFRFWENFVNSKDTVAESKLDTLKKVNKNLSQGTALPDSSLKKDSLNTKVDQAITDNSVKKTALYYEEPKTLENKTYCLIVGSFGKRENAQKLAEKYIQRGFKTEIIQGNAMYRVSINKFTDKNRALSEFNKFRSNYPGESIWLLEI